MMGSLRIRFHELALPLLAVVIGLTIWYSETITTPHPKPGPVHITYWEKWTDFEADAMRDVVNAFNRSQNRIYVDFLTVSRIENKTLMAISGNIPPDVAGLYSPNVALYADANAVLSLDDYCRKFHIDRSQYIPAYWDICTYHGHIVSLPTTPASTALHINTALLKPLGYDAHHPPQTIEEMDAAAEKVTTRVGGQIDKAGFLPAEPGWWNWAWGYVFGGQLWNGKDRITANSPENIRAFTWVQSYSRKYGRDDLQKFRSGFGTFSSPQNAFLDDKVAMEIQGVWMYNFITKFSPKLQWAAVPFPHPADRPDLANLTVVDADILVIPRGAKHPDEAFEFIRFVQSQKGMEMLCLGQKKHSPLLQVSADFYEKHPNPYIRLFAELPKSPNAVHAPQLGIWPEYQAELANAFDEIVLLNKTPRQALDKVQARMQPKLEEYQERLRLRQQSYSQAAVSRPTTADRAVAATHRSVLTIDADASALAKNTDAPVFAKNANASTSTKNADISSDARDVRAIGGRVP